WRPQRNDGIAAGRSLWQSAVHASAKYSVLSTKYTVQLFAALDCRLVLARGCHDPPRSCSVFVSFVFFVVRRNSSLALWASGRTRKSIRPAAGRHAAADGGRGHRGADGGGDRQVLAAGD